ncbi:hypothetical protein [Spirosoma montaniterrae]|uniref:Lipocalin-like domain-containing protein n=1 Tax=Spirosoma montaniterrae TaxID=1178516 RepID=A0A1P9X4V4_9BACT|nr:hypothetical protein [Spirosoma montaniterrae]AQG82680.1 hypothetical protein AWR27_24165 [Spirosoma montaniterrae]
MKTLLRFILLPVLCGVLFGGCSERLEPKPLTYTQLLTGTTKKSWRVVSVIINDNGQSSGVIPIQQAGIPACFADDLYTFYANDERRLEISEGATKCSPNDPDIYVTDSWILVNANASLEFVLPILAGFPIPFTIKNLTGDVLTVEYYFGDVNASYRFTFNAVR